MNAPRSKLFDELVIKSWWVLLFFLIVLILYDQAIKRTKRETTNLYAKVDALNEAMVKEKLLQEELQRIIDSQEDPAWRELVLMHKLGLVPKGQTKIHFVSPSS